MDIIDWAIDKTIDEKGSIHEAKGPKRIHVIPQKGKDIPPYVTTDPADVPYRVQRQIPKGAKIGSYLNKVPEYATERPSEDTILERLMDSTNRWFPKNHIRQMWNEFKKWVKSEYITDPEIIKGHFKQIVAKHIIQPTEKELSNYAELKELQLQNPSEFANKMTDNAIARLYHIMKTRGKLVDETKRLAGRLASEVANLFVVTEAQIAPVSQGEISQYFEKAPKIDNDANIKSKLYQKWLPIMEKYGAQLAAQYNKANYNTKIDDQNIVINLAKDYQIINIIKSLTRRIDNINDTLSKLFKENKDTFINILERQLGSQSIAMFDGEPIEKAMLEIDGSKLYQESKKQFIKILTSLGLEKSVNRNDPHAPRTDMSADYLCREAMRLAETGRSNRISDLVKLVNLDRKIAIKVTRALQAMGMFWAEIKKATNNELVRSGVLRDFDVIRRKFNIAKHEITNVEIRKFILNNVQTLLNKMNEYKKSIYDNFITPACNEFIKIGMSNDMADLYAQYSLPPHYNPEFPSKSIMSRFNMLWTKTEKSPDEALSPDSDAEEETTPLPDLSEKATLSKNLANRLIEAILIKNKHLINELETIITTKMDLKELFLGDFVSEFYEFLRNRSKNKRGSFRGRDTIIAEFEQFIYKTIADIHENLSTQSIKDLVNTFIVNRQWGALSLLANNSVFVPSLDQAIKDFITSALSTNNKNAIKWTIFYIKSMPNAGVGGIDLNKIIVNPKSSYEIEFEFYRQMGLSKLDAMEKLFATHKSKEVAEWAEQFMNKTDRLKELEELKRRGDLGELNKKELKKLEELERLVNKSMSAYEMLHGQFHDIKGQMTETGGIWIPGKDRTPSWYADKINAHITKLKILIKELGSYLGVKKFKKRRGDPSKSKMVTKAIANEISDDPELDGILEYVQEAAFVWRKPQRTKEQILNDIKRVYVDFRRFEKEYSELDQDEVEPNLDTEVVFQKAAKQSIDAFPFVVTVGNGFLKVYDRRPKETYQPKPIEIALIGIDQDEFINSIEEHMEQFPHTYMHMMAYQKIPFVVKNGINFYLNQQELAYFLGGLKPYQGEYANSNIKRFGIIIGTAINNMGPDVTNKVIKKINLPLRHINFWYDKIAKPDTHEKEILDKVGKKQSSHEKINRLIETFPEHGARIRKMAKAGADVGNIKMTIMALAGAGK